MGAKHLNLSTVVDKNKVSSDKAFLVLFKVVVRDYLGVEVDTLRFAKNSENVVFAGDVYQAANFNLDIQVEEGKEPSVTLTAQDQTKTLATYVDLYDGLVKSDVTLYIVNEGALDGPPEIAEDFIVSDATTAEYIVTLTLGTESAVAQRFPNFRQFRNRCAWKYKGERCKYSGAMPTCDFTRDGANGCIAHGNEENFGGFPGLNDLF
jgi:phage-related protein